MAKTAMCCAKRRHMPPKDLMRGLKETLAGCKKILVGGLNIAWGELLFGDYLPLRATATARQGHSDWHRPIVVVVSR